jgi:hypothetical protein
VGRVVKPFSETTLIGALGCCCNKNDRPHIEAQNILVFAQSKRKETRSKTRANRHSKNQKSIKYTPHCLSFLASTVAQQHLHDLSHHQQRTADSLGNSLAIQYSKVGLHKPYRGGKN